MAPSIIKIENPDHLCLFVDIIRNSFNTVAVQYGLTQENSPTNPAFTTIENLQSIASKADCFGLYIKDIPCGFFALEFNPDCNVFYIERICVLPEFRNNGFGELMLKFAENYCRNKNAEKISIGIMNQNNILKKWYQQNGFIEIDVRQYPHLTFDVCFLENRLK
jgi:ribosomal protein S18 acetylase RimI-like enzyme